MNPHRLTPVRYKEVPGKWPFVLVADLTVELAGGFIGRHVFLDNGVPYGEITGDRLTIYAGYGSDGASPYFGKICGLRIGTPSHARTAPGFFVHDFLYQFAELPCCPWDYQQADDALYWLMRNEGSRLGSPYHAAVSIFGGMHRRITGRTSTTVACITHHHETKNQYNP